jgi:hypothetical protein
MTIPTPSTSTAVQPVMNRQSATDTSNRLFIRGVRTSSMPMNASDSIAAYALSNWTKRLNHSNNIAENTPIHLANLHGDGSHSSVESQSAQATGFGG